MDLASYSLDDIETACKQLGMTRRAEGETAFPDVATILEAVRGVIRARKPSADQEAANRWLEYMAAAKAEGVTEPDEATLEQIAKLNERLSL